MKLKLSQKILLVIACAFYVGFLIFFIRSFSYGVLGSAIGMGVFFLFTIMLGLPREDDDYDESFEEETEEPEGERVNVNSLIDQLAERREDIDAKKAEIASKDDEIKRLKEKYDESRVELTEMANQKQFYEEKVASLEASLKAATNKLTAVEGEGNYETILPDAKNDPPKVINIGTAAESAANDLKDAAAKAGITIRTVSTDATLMVKASPTMIDVLFKNIIDNAIKYMSREGTLQITISRIEQELFIVMKDNGEGLASDETEHIFELNFQGTNRISGNGLGLAQARAIVEYYGGMIYARSSKGSGMGIYIHLPSAI